MQVRTGRIISDEESVELAVKKIVEDLRDAEIEIQRERVSREERYRGYSEEAGQSEILQRAISKYNGGTAYATEVFGLYYQLKPLVTNPRERG
jgi:hypothetical protein